MLKVEDVNRKFIELKNIEANDWKLEERVTAVKPSSVKKSSSRKRSCQGKAAPTAGLKALIAAKRKCLAESVGVTVTVNEKENLPQQERGETSPEKTFDGGFFTIKSPFCEDTSGRRVQHPDTRVTRSAGQLQNCLKSKHM